MLTLESNNCLTAEQIAEIVQISRRAVAKKLIYADKYLHDIRSSGGRPQKFYNKSVLELFPQAKLYQKIEQETKPKLSAKRTYSGRGKNRYISEALELKIKNQAYNYYLNQARRDNIELCTRWAVQDYWQDIKSELEQRGKNPDLKIEKFLWYFYSKRITRKDGYWVGYAHKENWQLAWESVHKVNELNGALPYNSYEYIELFENIGLLGQGFGAGLIWIVDATQFDVWTDKDGKKQTVSYLLILDGITRMPLYVQMLEKGESVQDISKAFAQCLEIHGKPSMGVLMDNGSAFRSAELRNYIKSWYNPEELDQFEHFEFRKKLFGGQTDPYLYPLAKIPRFPFKAVIERMFDELNRHQSECYPFAYIGTRDSRSVTHELGSTPSVALLNAPQYTEAFQNFLYWIYTDYVNRVQGSQFRYFSKKYKQAPTILSAWQFYGGKFNITDFQINTEKVQKKLLLESATTANQFNIPEVAKAYEAYAIADDSKKHRVTAGLGYVTFVEDNLSYNIHCEYLSQFQGRQVVAVLDGRKAYLFKEFDANWFDELTPREGDLCYIGTGKDHTIRQENDLEIRHESTELRKNLQKTLTQQVNNSLNDSRQKTDGKLLNYKEIRYLDEAIDDNYSNDSYYEDEIDKLLNS